MSYEGVIDPETAAGIASTALEQALAVLPRVQASATAAAASAKVAAAVQTAITALLAGIGLPIRWTGTALQIRLPDGSYSDPVDLKGGQGDTGDTPVIHIGTVMEGEFAVIADVADPNNPYLDFVLERGLAAWTPVPAIITDGARRVVQIVDWTGGQGSKPATGLYIGPAGLVADLGSAVDIRGAANTSGDPAGGGTVTHSGTPAATHLARFASPDVIEDAGAVLSTFGQGLISAATAAAVKALLAIAAGDVAELGNAATRSVGTATGTVAAGDDSRIVGAEQTSRKGQAGGYAGLDGAGKVPTSQLPASVLGALNYQGAWDASANSPSLASGTGAKGAYYKVVVAGTTALDGLSQWLVGDSVVFDGTSWDKIDGVANEVISVAGLYGAVQAAALKAALALAVADVAGAAPLASPFLTGNPTAPTQSAGDNSTRLATTAYADRAATAAASTIAGAFASQDDLRVTLIELAKLKGGTINLVAGVVDDFQTQTGVDAANSVNAVYDATGRFYGNVSVETSQSLPAMTSNTAPSGVASASSTYSGSYPAYQAFDQSNGTFWASNGTYPAWLQRQLPAPVTLGAYAVRARADDTSYNATAWTFAGSNDGSTWTTLDTQSGQTGWAASERRLYTIPAANRGSYSYHRLTVTAGTSSTAAEIAELELLKQVVNGDLDLRSIAYTASAVPGKASLFVLAKASSGGTITPNTNLIGQVSRDGGTTWTSMTLTVTATLSSGLVALEANGVDISAQPSGTALKWRIRTVSLSALVQAVVEQWG